VKGKAGMSKKLVAGVAMATVLFGSGSVYALYSVIAGPKPDGTGVTSGGWDLTPAGKQVTLGSFPMGGALSPDQQYLVVVNAGAGIQSLQVVDVQQQKVVQTVPYMSPEAVYLGVAFSPDGKHVYASAGGNNKIRTFSFANGTLRELAPIQMKDPASPETQFYPAGLSVSPDGKALYVANNLHNSVSRVDLATGQIAATTPVGQRPYTAQLSRDGNTVYVSNWGESSVTVLNAKDLTVRKTIAVGLHPNAVAENPVTGLIYVANSDSDEISVVDPRAQAVRQTISLAPYRGAPTGSQPDALTITKDGKTLYVANALNNDVAVIDVGSGERGEAKVKGLIPTAWYPTGVFAGADDKQLMVLNAKGLGAGPNDVNHGWSGNMIQGSISMLAAPDAKQLKAYTQQVEANNHVQRAVSAAWFKPQQTKQPFPLPRHDDKSPIKHVIYVIKENQTYDHIFGDLGKGNGDPTLALFGKDVTPNHHKLANQFVTLDNFYADGEVSADGHNWTTAAKANDYTQKNWLADYSGRNRDYDFEGGGGGNQPSGAPFSRSKAGYIWDVAMEAGLSFRNYGEFMHNYDPITKQYYPSDAATNNFGGHYDPAYPGWDLQVSDMTRYQEWEREFKDFEQNGKLPQLETVYLPNDHTGGGKWGPQQMVAQNDLALGKLVETVSHSQYWKDTVIFVVEDDSQGGVDHVDAHRTVALAISPYTQKGTIDSTFYDTPSMLRTMELILGLKPMTQFEAAAIPMVNAFTAQPNLAPFKAEQSKFWLDAAGTSAAPVVPSPASVSNMDYSGPDTADRQALNLENWKAITGHLPPTPAKKD
jgi:YVTN family beta-propeller protein